MISYYRKTSVIRIVLHTVILSAIAGAIVALIGALLAIPTDMGRIFVFQAAPLIVQLALLHLATAIALKPLLFLRAISGRVLRLSDLDDDMSGYVASITKRAVSPVDEFSEHLNISPMGLVTGLLLTTLLLVGYIAIQSQENLLKTHELVWTEYGCHELSEQGALQAIRYLKNFPDSDQVQRATNCIGDYVFSFFPEGEFYYARFASRSQTVVDDLVEVGSWSPEDSDFRDQPLQKLELSTRSALDFLHQDDMEELRRGSPQAIQNRIVYYRIVLDGLRRFVEGYVSRLEGQLITLGYFEGPVDGVFDDGLVRALAQLTAESSLPPDTWVNAEFVDRIDIAFSKPFQPLVNEDPAAAVGFVFGSLEDLSEEKIGTTILALRDLGLMEASATEFVTLDYISALIEYQTIFGFVPTGYLSDDLYFRMYSLTRFEDLDHAKRNMSELRELMSDLNSIRDYEWINKQVEDVLRDLQVWSLGKEDLLIIGAYAGNVRAQTLVNYSFAIGLPGLVRPNSSVTYWGSQLLKEARSVIDLGHLHGAERAPFTRESLMLISQQTKVLAHDGNPRAQSLLASFYLEHFLRLGDARYWVDVDDVDDVEQEIVRLLQQASMANDPGALTLMGLLYHFGFGSIQKEEASALAYYQRAMGQNFVPAKHLRNLLFGVAISKTESSDSHQSGGSSVIGNCSGCFASLINFVQFYPLKPRGNE